MCKLFELANNAWAHQCSCVNPNITEFCFCSGYWSWDDTVDDDGNILDSEKVITKKDLQEALDALGIEFDVINL